MNNFKVVLRIEMRGANGKRTSRTHEETVYAKDVAAATRIVVSNYREYSRSGGAVRNCTVIPLEKAA